VSGRGWGGKTKGMGQNAESWGVAGATAEKTAPLAEAETIMGREHVGHSGTSTWDGSRGRPKGPKRTVRGAAWGGKNVCTKKKQKELGAKGWLDRFFCVGWKRGKELVGRGYHNGKSGTKLRHPPI